MAGALNVFKTVTANVTTAMTSVYTPPVGYATVVLMAQVSNLTGNTITISANVSNTSASTSTALIRNAALPSADAITVLTGRLILNVGENFQIAASANNSGQLTLSLLETLVT